MRLCGRSMYLRRSREQRLNSYTDIPIIRKRREVWTVGMANNSKTSRLLLGFTNLRKGLCAPLKG